MIGMKGLGKLFFHKILYNGYYIYTYDILSIVCLSMYVKSIG